MKQIYWIIFKLKTLINIMIFIKIQLNEIYSKKSMIKWMHFYLFKSKINS